MESSEAKNIIKILSTAYLYKKTGKLPEQEEVNKEMKRRECWLESLFNKYSGEEGFKIALQEIYNDPPEEYK